MLTTVGLILLGLVLVALVVLGYILHRAKQDPDDRRAIRVDGDDVPVYLHFRHWLPRKLGVWGFAMHRHVWMYAEQDDTPREYLAHELIHRIRTHLVGSVRATLEAAWEWATQRVWRRRGTEEEARRMGNILAQHPSSCPLEIAGRVVTVNAPWLREYPL